MSHEPSYRQIYGWKSCYDDQPVPESTPPQLDQTPPPLPISDQAWDAELQTLLPEPADRAMVLDWLRSTDARSDHHCRSSLVVLVGADAARCRPSLRYLTDSLGRAAQYVVLDQSDPRLQHAQWLEQSHNALVITSQPLDHLSNVRAICLV